MFPGKVPRTLELYWCRGGRLVQQVCSRLGDWVIHMTSYSPVPRDWLVRRLLLYFLQSGFDLDKEMPPVPIVLSYTSPELEFVLSSEDRPDCLRPPNGHLPLHTRTTYSNILLCFCFFNSFLLVCGGGSGLRFGQNCRFHRDLNSDRWIQSPEC